MSKKAKYFIILFLSCSIIPALSGCLQKAGNTHRDGSNSPKNETGRFADTWRDYSSGPTGCLSEDIIIRNSKKDILFGKFNWTAVCNGKEYRCMWVEKSGPATCNPVPTQNTQPSEAVDDKPVSAKSDTNSSKEKPKKYEKGRFADTWRDYSAGPTGCLSEDVLISNSKKDILFGKFNWTATCKGKEYRCMWVEGSGPATCNPVPSQKTSPPEAAANKPVPAQPDNNSSKAKNSPTQKPVTAEAEARDKPASTQPDTNSSKSKPKKYEKGRFADTWRDYSAGPTGCLSEDILISNSKKDILFGKFNWTATCKGKEYRCMWVEGSGPATCNPVPSK